MALIHLAEAFLLEALGAGHTPFEVEEAVRLAFDRWRVVTQEPAHGDIHTLRFVGSHDPGVAWLATHFPEIVPGYRMQISFTGSLGGLIALAEGKTDLAGSHLWDDTKDNYNVSYVQRVLPGKRIALVTLAHRRLGLIVPPGNPGKLTRLMDLCQLGLRFINRQPGSGTRVWLDAQMRQLGISPTQIPGYANERMTHSDVAQAIAEGRADVGLGLEAAARTCGLEFVMLTRERYDLVIPAELLETAPVYMLVEWLQSPNAHETIASLGGYEVSDTGSLEWVT